MPGSTASVSPLEGTLLRQGEQPPPLFSLSQQEVVSLMLSWYGRQDVAASLGKLECLSFDQPKEVVSTVRATAVSGESCPVNSFESVPF